MRLWKIGMCVGLLLSASQLHAQTAQYAFRINFKDKQGSPALSSPLVFLSQRALDRRAAQGISLDSTDQPVAPAYVNDVVATTTGKFHSASKWMNSIVILLTDSSKILTIQSKPYITGITYVGYFSTGLHKISGNTTEPLQTPTPAGSASYYGAAYDQTVLVNGPYLHDRGYKGKGKLIALLDEGFFGVNTAPAFDSMIKAGRVLDTWNFVYASGDVYSAYNHGTGCLSTTAGNLPGTYVGSAPEASYALYVTEYSFADYPVEMDDMAAATERADSLGADIVSSSLGYNTFSGAFPDLVHSDIDGKTTVAAKAANMASAKGMLFVITAGNEGGNTWNSILTPGDADSALTVGNVNNAKDPASNSGYGPNAAGRIKPDVCMKGNPASVMFTSATPGSSSGTSFATPQLAGWAACLWQSNPGSTPYQVREAIRKSAHMYTTPGNHIGYGVPDFYRASELLNVKQVPETISTDNWVNVAPNPTTQTLQIELLMNASAPVSLTVIDASGKEIYTDTRNTKTGKQNIAITIPGISKGVYFLKAITGDKQRVVRFIQQ